MLQLKLCNPLILLLKELLHVPVLGLQVLKLHLYIMNLGLHCIVSDLEDSMSNSHNTP